MYAVVHGIWCNTRTFPLNCKCCGEGIFYFSCECGSRVLFDDLGPPWPMHNCRDDTPPSTPSPTSDDYFRNTQGVVNTVRDENTSGILPGMRRFSGSVDMSIIQRVEQSESRTREIVAIEPYSGGRREAPIGIVRQMHVVSIEERFNITPNSVVGRQTSRILGSFDVTQITIHVDEIALDPDAEDLMSYTFWCNPQNMPKSLSIGDVVSSTIKPTDFMGIGVKWLASAIEIL